MDTNITTGKWEVRSDVPYSTGGFKVFRGRGENNKTIVHLPYGNIIPCPQGKGYHENKANAELIAEAGTVTNETGFTPRQLADQKADLLAIVAECDDYLKGNKLNNIGNGSILHTKMKKAMKEANWVTT